VDRIVTKKLLYKAEYNDINSKENLPDLTVEEIRNVLMIIDKGIIHNEYNQSCRHEYELNGFPINFRGVLEGTRKDISFIYKIKTSEVDYQTGKVLFFRINNDRQKVSIVSFFTKPKNNTSEHRIYQIGPKTSDSMELINSFVSERVQPETEGFSEEELVIFYENMKNSKEFSTFSDTIKHYILLNLIRTDEEGVINSKYEEINKEYLEIRNRIRENYEKEEVTEEIKAGKSLELPSSLEQKIKPSKTTISTSKSLLYKQEYKNIENIPEITPEQIGDILVQLQMIPHYLDYEINPFSVNFRNIKNGTRKDLSYHYAHMVPIFSDTPDEQGITQIIRYNIKERVIKVDMVSFFTIIKDGVSEFRIYQIGRRYGTDDLTVNDLYGLGELNYDVKLYDEAIKLFKRGLEIKKDDLDFLVILGLCYVCKEEFGEAVRVYQKVLEIDSEDAITWDNLGIAYERSGDLENARKAYQKASGLEPEDKEIKEHFEQIDNRFKQG